MGVNLSIRRTGDRQEEDFILTGANGWKDVWLPVANELGLDLVPLIGDGTFTVVDPEYLPLIVEQLATLREWMASHGQELYVEFLDKALLALRTIRSGEDSVSFG